MDYSSSNLTFEKVGGLEIQKQYLRTNIINILADPENAKKIGLEPPKGILFYGVPGSGKTLLASAFANELGTSLRKKVTFIFHKGTESFGPYVGQTSENLKKIFIEAISKKPSVIFFDELDGLCPSRDKAGETSGEAYNTVVTTLLGLMDTIQRGEVFVIGATNRMAAIDPAMLRPGRFDKKLVFRAPNEDGRNQIFDINFKKWASKERPNPQFVKSLSRRTVGYTGADIEKLCREAFFEAFDRQNPEDVNVGNLTTKNLKVLAEDWDSAFKKIIPTDSNTFGDCLFIPKSVPENALPLLERPTTDIIDRLLLDILKVNRGNNPPPNVFGFLVFDTHDASGFILDNYLISNVLNQPQLSNYPTFVISEEKLFTREMNFRDAVHQAIDASPSILLILRLDSLVQTYSSHAIGMLVTALKELRGKPILLLATARSSSQLGDCQPFFGRSIYSVDNPCAHDVESFFSPIFQNRALEVDINDPILKKETKKSWTNALKELQEQCVVKTTGYRMLSLLNLYAKLYSACTSHLDQAVKQDLFTEMKEIIDLYLE